MFHSSAQSNICILPFCAKPGSSQIIAIDTLHQNLQQQLNKCQLPNNNFISCDVKSITTDLLQNKIEFLIAGSYFSIGDSFAIELYSNLISQVKYKHILLQSKKFKLNQLQKAIDTIIFTLNSKPALTWFKKSNCYLETFQLSNNLNIKTNKLNTYSLSEMQNEEAANLYEFIKTDSFININYQHQLIDLLLLANNYPAAIKHINICINNGYKTSVLAYIQASQLLIKPSPFYQTDIRRIYWFNLQNKSQKNSIINLLNNNFPQRKKTTLNLAELWYLFNSDILSFKNVTCTEIKNYRSFTQIKTLYLNKCKIKDLSVLDAFCHLREVHLYKCKNSKFITEYLKSKGVEVFDNN